jgi:hypothetical protein
MLFDQLDRYLLGGSVSLFLLGGILAFYVKKASHPSVALYVAPLVLLSLAMLCTVAYQLRAIFSSWRSIPQPVMSSLQIQGKLAERDYEMVQKLRDILPHW